ncbi:multiple sugar transport system permease protein [Cohaesibacter sp. ES.047]|uniref:carbohydrate ABC transporter permease n=1 Tax=Cohaesibacter sp. ES.047 TaxID=1798205 RepID=UPI000BB81478|nr:carbohydrate ABC transporter permease [Cohaesibacter sp. ES.047]SNY90202.1 multiple sugar transport system permease protein [Cohaesibacter sp. ES.047]
MKRSLLWNVVLALVIFFFLALILMPFWWVVSGSVKSPQEIIARVPTMVPNTFSLQHYQKLLNQSDYMTYMVNSISVATFSTLITLLLAVPAAYAFFRLKFPGRETLFRIILLAYAFPSIVVLIPLFGMFAKLGLIDTRTALVVVNVTFALPFSIWMLRSFFSSVPLEIEEAAIMDGAPPLIILRRIMIPLIAPGIASVGIFAFVSAWTEYVFTSVIILSDANRTVPVGFSGIIGQYQIDWGLLLAGASFATLPVILLFALIGRWFVAGLTEGAVK